MAKLEQVDLTKPESAIAPEPTVEVTIEPQEHTLELSRGMVARFRSPMVGDLIACEKKGVNLTDRNDLMRLCREMAAMTCLQWGAESKMPEPDRIRRADSDAKVTLFLNLLSGVFEDADVSGVATVRSGQSKRHEGFDAYEIELPNGDRVVFDEPTEADMQKKEKSRTYTEGMLKLAASLCSEWNGEAVHWTKALQRLSQLSLEGFFRVANTLNTFSG